MNLCTPDEHVKKSNDPRLIICILDGGGLPINIQIYKYPNIGALLDRGGLPRAWGPGDHQVGDCESSRQVSLQIIRLAFSIISTSIDFDVPVTPF